MKFKEGDKVVLKAHSMDSEVNLEIGFKGVVLDINCGFNQAIQVRWEKGKVSRDWWVEEHILKKQVFVLENK